MQIVPFEPSYLLKNMHFIILKNDRHISKLHQIRFRPRLRHGPLWGILQRSPRPPRGPTSKEGEGREGEEEREGREGERREGMRQWAVPLFWTFRRLWLCQSSNLLLEYGTCYMPKQVHE